MEIDLNKFKIDTNKTRCNKGMCAKEIDIRKCEYIIKVKHPSGNSKSFYYCCKSHMLGRGN